MLRISQRRHAKESDRALRAEGDETATWFGAGGAGTTVGRNRIVGAEPDSDELGVPGPRRVVVGVDGSAESIDALQRGSHFATLLGVPLVAIAVWQYPESRGTSWAPERSAEAEAEQFLAAAAEAVLGKNPPEWFSGIVRAGSAAKVLVKESAGAEMLILGSRGRGGFSGMLLGSVSATCAEHAQCPVLVVHHARKEATVASV